MIASSFRSYTYGKVLGLKECFLGRGSIVSQLEYLLFSDQHDPVSCQLTFSQGTYIEADKAS